MKKLLIILLVISLTGCLGSKSVAEKTTEKTTTEKVESKTDTVSKVTVNKKIDDKITTKIADTNDPYLDAKIDEILLKINTTKTSGSNSYNLYFNKKTRELIAEFKIAKTQDSIANTNKEVISEKSTEEKVDEYLSKKITALPWWIWIIVAYLLRKPILNILSFFFPQLRLITTFSALTKRKNDKL